MGAGVTWLTGRLASRQRFANNPPERENKDLARDQRQEGPCANGRSQYHLTIKEMPRDERPQEKLKLRGAASLSTGELLAIILRTGLVGETVIDVAQRLLATHGGLLGLSRVAYGDLCKERGLGEVKAAQLQACIEIGPPAGARTPGRAPAHPVARRHRRDFSSEMAALDQEELRVVLLNTKNEVLKVVTVYRGSVNAAQIRVAEVFKEAIRLNAPSIVSPTTTPPAIPRRHLTMSPSRANWSRPASYSTSKCSTIW